MDRILPASARVFRTTAMDVLVRDLAEPTVPEGEDPPVIVEWRARCREKGVPMSLANSFAAHLHDFGPHAGLAREIAIDALGAMGMDPASADSLLTARERARKVRT